MLTAFPSLIIQPKLSRGTKKKKYEKVSKICFDINRIWKGFNVFEVL